MITTELVTTVPLNEERTPVAWCVPPASGSPMVYLPLADATDGRIGLLGLALTEQAPDVVALEDVVAGYAESVAEEAGAVILGWSVGGILAFEVVRWLHDRRGLTPPLVLIDTQVPRRSPMPPDAAWLLDRFAADVLGLSGWPVADDAPPEIALARAFTAGRLPPGLDGDAVLSLFRRYRSLILELSAHEPTGRYPGPVLHLRASTGPPVDQDWSPYAPDLRTVVVDGHHRGLLADTGEGAGVGRVADELAAWVLALP